MPALNSKVNLLSHFCADNSIIITALKPVTSLRYVTWVPLFVYIRVSPPLFLYILVQSIAEFKNTILQAITRWLNHNYRLVIPVIDNFLTNFNLWLIILKNWKIRLMGWKRSKNWLIDQSVSKNQSSDTVGNSNNK